MKGAIFNVTFYFQIIAFLITLYYLIISMFGIYKKKEKSIRIKPDKKFALIVAAHNEELVIANIIESLNNLDYPKKLYDIYVIADNCCDRTSEIAKALGANVYERNNVNKRGKGYALEWMFNNIFGMGKKYDTIGIFDADNLVSRNFLLEMNKKMNQGYKVVQGYLDSKNPFDTWISESYSIAFWTSNRMFQYPRWKLGLSNQIGGTGFCISFDILRELGWGATCLTEDLEFTCKMVLNGYKVGWAHEAVIYDEKPLTLKQSWIQRKRWMQGFADVASRYFFKLMKRAFLKGDIVAFDCAMYTIQPFIIVILSIAAILTFLQNNTRGLNIYILRDLFITMPVGWYIYSVFQFIFTPFVMLLERKISKKLFLYVSAYSLNIMIFGIIYEIKANVPIVLAINIIILLVLILTIILSEGRRSFKTFLCIIFYGLYTLTWLPITIQGIINKNNKDWKHTRHTRQISINEIEDVDEGSIA